MFAADEDNDLSNNADDNLEENNQTESNIDDRSNTEDIANPSMDKVKKEKKQNKEKKKKDKKHKKDKKKHRHREKEETKLVDANDIIPNKSENEDEKPIIKRRLKKTRDADDEVDTLMKSVDQI